MLISVIIPVYGQWDLTKQCLLSLNEHTPLPIEVILVDNGAVALLQDKTSEEAPTLGRELFGDRFIYLPQEKNINFAGACNLGAREAHSPILFFLNNDTLILPNYFMPLLEAIEHAKQPAVVAPLLLYPANETKQLTIQHIGVYFNPIKQAFHLYEHFPLSHRIVRRKRELQCMTGAAMLIYKDLFFQAGAFCEDYKNGFEDVELMGRLRFMGTRLNVVPESQIVHLCSQSSGRHDSNKENSHLFFRSKAYDAFVPDYHTLLENDGYELHFNAFMQFEPRLNKEHERSLQHFIENDDIDALEENYAKEPFWYSGLNAILKHYRTEPKKKLYYTLQGLKFSTSIDLCLDLAQMSLKKNDIITAQALLENYTKLTSRFGTRKEDLNNLLPILKSCSDIMYLDAREHLVKYDYFMQNEYKALEERYKTLLEKSEYLEKSLLKKARKSLNAEA